MTAKDLLNTAIQTELKQWLPQLEAQLRGAADKKLKKSSGRGSQSFRARMQVASGVAAMAQIDFAGYLRFFDMRKVNKSQANMEAIAKYIVQKGVNKFARKFEKIYGRPITSSQADINRMAWGMSRGMKRKRRPWYNKNKEASIYGDLYPKMMDAVTEAALKQLKTSLTS